MSSIRNKKEKRGKTYPKKGLPSYITSIELEKGWRQRQAFLRYQKYLKKLLAAIYKEEVDENKTTMPLVRLAESPRRSGRGVLP